MFYGYVTPNFLSKCKDYTDYFKMSFINFKTFCDKNNLKTCEDKVNYLKKFLCQVQQKRLALLGFPETDKQYKLF